MPSGGEGVMKATFILIQNDADHAQAKAMIDKLMASDSPADHAKLAGLGAKRTCRHLI
jgi:hypothetical protein